MRRAIRLHQNYFWVVTRIRRVSAESGNDAMDESVDAPCSMLISRKRVRLWRLSAFASNYIPFRKGNVRGA